MQALVIHDSFLTRTILSSILVEQNFDVRRAKGEADALALLDAGLQPDVVLLHLNLPGPSAPALLAEIRRRCRTQGVLVGDEADAGLLDQALLRGADAWLHCPFTAASVEAVLQRLGLAGGRAQQAALLLGGRF